MSGTISYLDSTCQTLILQQSWTTAQYHARYDQPTLQPPTLRITGTRIGERDAAQAHAGCLTKLLRTEAISARCISNQQELRNRNLGLIASGPRYYLTPFGTHGRDAKPIGLVRAHIAIACIGPYIARRHDYRPFLP